MKKVTYQSLFVSDFTNRTFIIQFFIVVFFIFLCISCDRKNEENAIRFNTIQTEKTAYLFNDTLKPSCNLKVHFIYPDSARKQSLSILQSIFIEKTLDVSFRNLTPEKALEVYAQQYLKNFKRFELPEVFNENFCLETEDDPGENKGITGFYYYNHLTNRLLYNRNGLVSFTVQNIVYEGGARCSQTLHGYVIDLNNNRLLNEGDFAGTNYKQYIAPILAKKIALSNGLENPVDLENIGYFSLEDIVPNNNFTIDDKGITYYFNEGEIAGIIIGLVQVFLPYEEISIYLKDDNPMISLTY
jgi:hypothetical protein